MAADPHHVANPSSGIVCEIQNYWKVVILTCGPTYPFLVRDNLSNAYAGIRPAMNIVTADRRNCRHFCQLRTNDMRTSHPCGWDNASSKIAEHHARHDNSQSVSMSLFTRFSSDGEVLWEKSLAGIYSVLICNLGLIGCELFPHLFHEPANHMGQFACRRLPTTCLRIDSI